MAQRTPLDWRDLERELHAAGVSAEEIETGPVSCWPRRAGISSPRLGSSWAWARSRWLARWA
jgi:hypothetical protein